MDDRRFDQLARALATTTSRRRFLRGLTTSALAGSLAAAGLKTGTPSVAAETTCGGANAQCSQDSDCCSGSCDTDNGVCASPSEGDPCDPSSETSCSTAGLTCCADENSSTGGTCTSVDSGCPGDGQCRGAQAQCDQDSQCCSGKCLEEIHECSNAIAGQTPCEPSGPATCNVAGLVCCPDKDSPTGGTCTAITDGCLPPGQCNGGQEECWADVDCCSGKCDLEQGVCTTPSEGDPCDPISATSCNAAGLTCCSDTESSTGGTCTSADTGCPPGHQPPGGNDQGGSDEGSQGGTTSPVSSLPNTGSGTSEADHNNVITATLLGAAGAAVAARKIHKQATKHD